MNKYIVVIQDPKGYPTKLPSREEVPNPPSPTIHTAVLVADIEKYLDESIVLWRNKRDSSNGTTHRMARHYIDAFQSVRATLLGELLP